MSRVSKSGLVDWFPQSEYEIAQVREELERVLAHPLFQHSLRYPALLRYAVEQTLLGNADQLKERTIGVEVFGRQPDYDLSSDPIVRFAASEVRKRLAQYYVDPAHSSELKIDLPIGAYIAALHPPLAVHVPAESSSPPELEHNLALDATPGNAIIESSVPQPVTASGRRWTITKWGALCATLTGVAGLCAGFWVQTLPVAGRLVHPQVDSIDKFWAPITNAPGIVTICIGEPDGHIDARSGPATIESGSTPQPLHSQLRLAGRLDIADVMTLTQLSDALGAHGKAFRISAAFHTNFSQLREGPVILIGAFDNPWTERLTRNLRYTFSSVDGVASIVDRSNSGQTRWSTNWDIPYQKLARDYALIARFHDPTTGQFVVLIGGISDEGTEAAGEFLTNPAYFSAVVKQAPRNWQAMNMEIVLDTEVIDGRSGPPRALASEFW